MPALAWRDATDEDRLALQQFECAQRAKRLGRTVFPRPWERVAEASIRQVNPRCDARSALRVGFDDDGLAAVASVGWNASYQAYVVEVVAINNRLRGTGSTAADEALEEAVQWVLARSNPDELTQTLLIADLDPRNNASRHLLNRHGFTLSAKDSKREIWIYEHSALPLGDL